VGVPPKMEAIAYILANGEKTVNFAFHAFGIK
jgi:hypothetical protein